MAVAAGGFHLLAALCALLGALLIQVGTNFSNDYADFLKGADTADRKGPLRVTQAGLVTPQAMRWATALVFGLAVAAGGYLIWRGGWPVLAIGVLSIISGILYTVGRYSLAYLGIADLFVLVFFGPVAVGGTYYVQALSITPTVLLMGLGPGLLSVAILLVNNIRDVDEDRAANKRTLVVRFGRGFGVVLYVVCIAVAVVLPVAHYLATGTHPWAMLTLGIVPLVPRIVRTLRTSREATHLNPLLGATSRLLLIYSVLFAIGWNL
jgi:1,4-dihydroxy-2-naphthoate octaprenyltransferase